MYLEDYSLKYEGILSTNGTLYNYSCDRDFISLVNEGTMFMQRWTVVCGANTSASERSFTLTLTYSFADGSTQSVRLTGTQAAAEKEPWLTVTPSSVTLDHNGATAEVEVDSSSDWTATDDQTWVGVSPTSGGEGVSVMTLRAMYPASGLPARGHLTVTNADGLNATVTVSPT